MTFDKSLLGRIALALGIGAVGGWVFTLLTMPLPWMLGAMLFNTIAAMLRAPIAPPLRLRPPMVLVLGVLLGSGFTPEIVGRLQEWAVSIAMLGLYLLVIGAAVIPFYIRVGRFDRTTAYFSGMPGGLNEMLLVGQAMGGDDRKIALAHAARILMVVFAVAFWFRLVEGLELGDRTAFGVSIVDIPPRDLLILAACGAVGWPLATLARLPAPQLIGPMLVSALVHILGWTYSQPPSELVNIAQLILGTIIGCRFVDASPAEMRRALALSAGATVIMMLVAGVFTILLRALTGIDPLIVLLAYAPGGLAEMSLVALALNADVAYVATHHMVRILMVVLAAPFIFKLFAPRPPPDRRH